MTGDTATAATAEADEGTRVWMVERTVSDDEQNVIIVVYATPDGRLYHRKERAVTSPAGGGPTFTAAVTVGPDKLGPVDDEATRERYATEASRMADAHDPDDPV